MSSFIDQVDDQLSVQLQEQQEVWMTLSDLFVDNEISHESIAKRVAHLTIKQVEHILFYEVAPVCMSNLLVVSPSVCKGFSENDIIPEVQRHLQKMTINKLYRYQVQLKAKLYRLLLKQDWIKIMTEIRQAQSKAC